MNMKKAIKTIILAIQEQQEKAQINPQTMEQLKSFLSE